MLFPEVVFFNSGCLLTRMCLSEVVDAVETKIHKRHTRLELLEVVAIPNELNRQKTFFLDRVSLSRTVPLDSFEFEVFRSVFSYLLRLHETSSSAN